MNLPERPEFQALSDFRTNLQRRRSELYLKQRELAGEISGLEAAYGELALEGKGPATQAKIDRLSKDLAALQKEAAALEKPNPSGGRLRDLIGAAWQESTDTITRHFRPQWEAKAAEAESAKAAFLDVVRELGQIKAAADRVSGGMMELLLEFGGPLKAVASLTTGIVEHRGAGSIFITQEESLKAFKSKGA